jgi:hypothetical protein
VVVAGRAAACYPIAQKVASAYNAQWRVHSLLLNRLNPCGGATHFMVRAA